MSPYNFLIHQWIFQTAGQFSTKQSANQPVTSKIKQPSPEPGISTNHSAASCVTGRKTKQTKLQPTAARKTGLRTVLHHCPIRSEDQQVTPNQCSPIDHSSLRLLDQHGIKSSSPSRPKNRTWMLSQADDQGPLTNGRYVGGELSLERRRGRSWSNYRKYFSPDTLRYPHKSYAS